MFQMIFEDKRK